MANQKHHAPLLIGYIIPFGVKFQRIVTLLQLQKRKREAGMSMTLPMAHLKSGRCGGNHNLSANGGWAATMRTGGKGYYTVVRGKKKKIHFILSQ